MDQKPVKTLGFVLTLLRFFSLHLLSLRKYIFTEPPALYAKCMILKALKAVGLILKDEIF